MTPSGPPLALTSSVEVVSLLDTVVHTLSRTFLRVMGFVALVRYRRLQRVENLCGSLFIVFLFQIFNLCYRSTVFVRLSFSHNCLCHCVLVLVCNYPATHPQVLTPDGFSEDFFNLLKVRYNMKKGLPEYSQLRAEIICIVRWGLISPQRPHFER